MTAACSITLGIALALYLAAALLFQGQFLLRKSGWDLLGRRSLGLGLAVHLTGMILHLGLANHPLLSNMLVVISWLVIILVIMLAIMLVVLVVILGISGRQDDPPW